MSDRISLDVLMPDEERVVVERDQDDLIATLAGCDFEPIPCRFREHHPFIDSFHCAT